MWGPSWHSLDRKKHELAEPVLTFGIRPREAGSDWNLLATGALVLSHIRRVFTGAESVTY